MHRTTQSSVQGDSQLLTGVVINAKPNIRRESSIGLRRPSPNCVRHGRVSQKRERDFKSHLAGRIAHVASLNWERGKKLQEIFRRIDWPAKSAGAP